MYSTITTTGGCLGQIKCPVSVASLTQSIRAAHSVKFGPRRPPFKPVRGSQRTVYTAAEAGAAPLL